MNQISRKITWWLAFAIERVHNGHDIDKAAVQADKVVTLFSERFV
jgi:diadenosine tetraphosphatase ApaH/serine/threonine PP2A family protein phosphatase